MIQKKIEEIIHNHPVVIFIKGTKDFPMCGFSSVVVTILKRLDIDFIDINVLDDPHIRQGIKDYSDWPTIPQLYIHGEFIGGCDITKELYEKGELQKLLNIM